ncbi:uncharacterized protein LOC116667782 [Camelus ferus]|uniref:Uncharacterized protein LOC116667782 n=1 Tax=Camelus ferus TaxID=419612 RepID=A0A8B8U685_CAMFR|nr:uncharacterized protein LOC116667782 [Camelus ferus]
MGYRVSLGAPTVHELVEEDLVARDFRGKPFKTLDIEATKEASFKNKCSLWCCLQRRPSNEAELRGKKKACPISRLSSNLPSSKADHQPDQYSERKPAVSGHFRTLVEWEPRRWSRKTLNSPPPTGTPKLQPPTEQLSTRMKTSRRGFPQQDKEGAQRGRQKVMNVNPEKVRHWVKNGKAGVQIQSTVSSISLELLDTMFLSFYLVCVLEES